MFHKCDRCSFMERQHLISYTFFFFPGTQ